MMGPKSEPMSLVGQRFDLDTRIAPNDAKGRPVTEVKLSTPLTLFPFTLFSLPELTKLDLSGTGLSSLPAGIRYMANLKIAFFSNCKFTTFPAELSGCPKLEMVAFRSNGMMHIPEDALPSRLRWLILTDNVIEALPRSIGRCERLQKCMLSGNQLTELPEEMQACRKLGLLRLSANRFETFPTWLFEMPELAYLSFAGNPLAREVDMDTSRSCLDLEEVAWDDLSITSVLGEGASGVISKAVWKRSSDRDQDVAVKIYKGAVTSDGTPLDEMEACIRAGKHNCLIDPIGKIQGHPEPKKHGLVMELIPPSHATLGLPPSLDTCTRDCFSAEIRLTYPQGLSILRGIASAATHLHFQGIAHGDLYAHNILYNRRGHALLGDFGAASIYAGTGLPMARLEVLAFGLLIDDVRGLLEPASNDGELSATSRLGMLQHWCATKLVEDRPSFQEIEQELEKIQQIRPR
jgi:hypothetical protein